MSIITEHGYIRVFVGIGHHLADSKGYAYEHRVVAEKKIGRRLQKGEIVHHVDGNKKHNTEDNIEVVQGNAGHYVHHRKRHDLRNPGEDNPLVSCECGCEEQFPNFDNAGRPRRYFPGHNTEKKQHNLCSCGCGEMVVTIDRHFRPGHRRRLVKIQEKVRCACGCGKTLSRYDGQWRERSYISGHNRRAA